MMRSLLDFSKESNRLLILLISADLFLIFIHILHGIQLRTSIDIYELLIEDVFSIQVDRSLGEAYMYVKEFWISLMLVVMAFRSKKGFWVYMSWGILFAYMMMDDMLSIHEELTFILPEYLNLQSWGRIRDRDFAEVIYSATIGLTSMLVLGLAYLKTDSVRRLHSRYFALMLISFAVFGVGVDFLHMLFTKTGMIINALLAMIEDGGEMFVMSLMAWTVFQLFDRDQIKEFSFIPFMKTGATYEESNNISE